MSLSKASSRFAARIGSTRAARVSSASKVSSSTASPILTTQNRTLSTNRVISRSNVVSGKSLSGNYIQTRFYAGKVEPFRLADIGEGIAEVEVLQWFVKEGDVISEFDPVCEVQSDKATVEIKSPLSGKVTKLHHKINDMAKVGQPLIDIETAGGSSSASADASAASTSAAPAAASHAAASHDSGDVFNEITTKSGAKLKVLATPAVRHMAKANSVDLSSVDGTGRDGRVTKSDLLGFLQNGGQKKAQPAPSASASHTAKPAAAQAAATAAAASAPILSDRTEQLRGYRKAMAKKMTEALSIPHFGYCDEITMDGLSRLRNELKPAAEQLGVKVTYMPFIIKACSLALKRYPLLNSSINKDLTEVTYHASHNIGIAVDTPAGLVVPNVKNCQNLSIFEIASELNRIIKLAQENKLPPSDLQGGTFSLSNIGALGGTYAKPVVVVPEVCIGALGKIQKLPRFDSNGNIIASQVMQVSWSADHRVIDGATIANFSNLMKRYLEFPNTMLADMK
eukprot:TRINITY_DN10396_c0_g1_i1.p1 TRINITY_DN10396_c0_g1~~TRINITY_DN10396_c0_g1_i1.p1  ORF type:complete len:511 (-),score=146.68 TRINITY_DN10396_c0_g1_i1:29-1561(-)